MPIFSLPSKYGIGSFGQAAYQWVDFLAEAKQSSWQVLPLGPTSYGDSPYQSFSAFAGNPYFIDIDQLQSEGLLSAQECEQAYVCGKEIDYAALFQTRFSLLKKAFQRFGGDDEFRSFCQENDWLEEYALYMALKQENGHQSWVQWEDKALRLRQPQALQQAKARLHGEMEFYCFLQWKFFSQWSELKHYANQKGIEIIGDMPIYVSMDSADVWANSHLFWLDESKTPIDVAGCPPDAFSEDGQLWGNPLYRWDVLAQTEYDWWIRRVKAGFKMYDIIRIDHFRGLESYYTIPFGEKTARKGEWRKGPDADFINALHRNFGKKGIIAEDLGFLTPAVHKLLRKSGYPGMKVLQFAFDSKGDSEYLPHHYTKNCVVYTGTHDNDTLCGWLETAPAADMRFARRYVGVHRKKDMCDAIIRLAMASVADLAIIPIQDYLHLGSEARINTPSTLGDNWVWQLDETALTPALAQEIAHLTCLYGRAKKEKKRGKDVQNAK